METSSSRLTFGKGSQESSSLHDERVLPMPSRLSKALRMEDLLDDAVVWATGLVD